jgi:hypothetical protein
LTKFNSLNLTGIGFGNNTNNLEPSTQGNPSLQLSENITYLDSLQLQNSGSTIPVPNNTLSDNLENMDIQDEIMDQEDDINSSRLPNNDEMDTDEDTDYKSSNTKNEYDVFLQELHDRVFDQVTERLKRSGIDFPP